MQEPSRGMNADSLLREHHQHQHPMTDLERSHLLEDKSDDNTVEEGVDPREEQQRLLLKNRYRRIAPHERPLTQHSSQSSIMDYISKSPLLSGKYSPFASSYSTSTRKAKPHKAGQHVLVLREDHVSLDELNPHPSCDTRKSSSIIAMINLVATVCGGGVLSLPLAFSKAGVWPTTLLLAYSAIVTDFSLICLVDSARKMGGRNYGDVTAAAFGSVAQVVTTCTLALMLCGTLIAYQVLVKDIWTPVIFFFVDMFRSSESAAEEESGSVLSHDGMAVSSSLPSSPSPESANILLALILLISMPLLLKKDLHALRHTCYVGFFSCVLLMMAVIYRAYEKVQDDWSPTSSVSLEIKWWTDDPSDVIFACPICILCFFCSYNVLAVHSQLVNPTRERIRFVLGLSMGLCYALFFGVGLCGYLYTADTQTPDNIMLAFEMSDTAILAGRIGFCFTLLFGLPLVLLPTREAIVSLPGQIRAWKEDTQMVHEYEALNEAYNETHSVDSSSSTADATSTTSSKTLSVAPTQHTKSQNFPHLVINGVDFDGPEPHLISADPQQRHGTAIVYGSFEPTISERTSLPASSSMDDVKNLQKEGVASFGAAIPRSDEQSQPVNKKMQSEGWKESLGHVTVTLLILAATYTAAIMVPGVASVWSIVGSSMAIWIAFVVPTACFLQIRQHKGLTMQALYAWLLLIASIISMIVCTKQAVHNAIHPQRS